MFVEEITLRAGEWSLKVSFYWTLVHRRCSEVNSKSVTEIDTFTPGDHDHILKIKHTLINKKIQSLSLDF